LPLAAKSATVANGGMHAELTIEAINRMAWTEFVRVLGGLFEDSAWVGEGAWRARPFPDANALHAAMVEVVRHASPGEQLELLRAHPDLAGKATRAGMMTASSVAEQSSAGLDRLSEAEYERFGRLNAAYRERFGFPFIIAVRRHDKASIFAAFEARVQHTREQEVETALAQVFDITRLRLERLVGAG
jgi:2-oxo-4-hydroxy-4-carboxy-5-ureidoimidazoline decarboxylase